MSEHFDKLPAQLRQAIAAETTASKIFNVSKKFQLNLRDTGEVSKAVAYLMLGILPSKSFVAEIAERLNIGQNAAQDIASEVNSEILFPIREHLRDLQEISLKSSQTMQAPQYTPAPATDKSANTSGSKFSPPMIFPGKSDARPGAENFQLRHFTFKKTQDTPQPMPSQPAPVQKQPLPAPSQSQSVVPPPPRPQPITRIQTPTPKAPNSSVDPYREFVADKERNPIKAAPVKPPPLSKEPLPVQSTPESQPQPTTPKPLSPFIGMKSVVNPLAKEEPKKPAGPRLEIPRAGDPYRENM